MKWTVLVGLMAMACASHRGKTISSKSGGDASLDGSALGSETGSGAPAPDGNLALSDSGGAPSDAAFGADTPMCQDGACIACPGTGGPAMVAVGTFCIDSTEVTQSQYRS
jgi:hypothetical protein